MRAKNNVKVVNLPIETDINSSCPINTESLISSIARPSSATSLVAVKRMHKNSKTAV
jgi:hypothetical protein